MPAALCYAIYALAIARLTTLAINDAIIEEPRNALRAWLLDHNHPKLWYLTTCPWCLSIWISAPAAPLIYYNTTQPWLIIPAMVLALSEVTGIIANHQGN